MEINAEDDNGMANVVEGASKNPLQLDMNKIQDSSSEPEESFIETESNVSNYELNNSK